MTAERSQGYWARLSRAGSPGEPPTTPGQYASALGATLVVVGLLSAWAVWTYAFDGTRQIADTVVWVTGRNPYVQAVAGAAWCAAGLLLLAERRRLPAYARRVALPAGLLVLVTCWLVVPAGQKHRVGEPAPETPVIYVPGFAAGIGAALLVAAVVFVRRRWARGPG